MRERPLDTTSSSSSNNNIFQVSSSSLLISTSLHFNLACSHGSSLNSLNSSSRRNSSHITADSSIIISSSSISSSTSSISISSNRYSNKWCLTPSRPFQDHLVLRVLVLQVWEAIRAWDLAVHLLQE